MLTVIHHSKGMHAQLILRCVHEIIMMWRPQGFGEEIMKGRNTVDIPFRESDEEAKLRRR